MDLDPEAALKTLGQHSRRMGEAAMTKHPYRLVDEGWMSALWIETADGQRVARLESCFSHERLLVGRQMVQACNSHDDLLAALERHEWFGTDWDTWRCASCPAEFQDGEERHHDDPCPTAAAIARAKEGQANA